MPLTGDCGCDDLGLPVGPTGDTGPQGDQGIQGLQGLQGIQGIPGTNGTNGVGYELTSQTSVSLPAAAVVNLTVNLADTASAYTAGARVRVSSTAAPTTNFFEGVITSYSGTSMVIAQDYTTSVVATPTSWNINIAGLQGSTVITETQLLDIEVPVIDTQCLTPSNNTLGALFNAILTRLCNTSPTTYPFSQLIVGKYDGTTFGTTTFSGLPALVPATVAGLLAGVSGFTWTVPGTTTRVKFELYGGGDTTGGLQGDNGCFILKTDGTNYYYATTGEIGSTSALISAPGGTSNCPTFINGDAGNPYGDATNPGSGIGGQGGTAITGKGADYAAGGAGPYLATGGGGGAYGAIELTVTPGDVYYIYTVLALGDAQSLVKISYN